MKLDKSASLPEPLRAPGEKLARHWLSLVVRDPDGLVYLWHRSLSNKERLAERGTWANADRDYSFAIDVRSWAPEGYAWQTGRYDVSGLTSVSGQTLDVQGGHFFVNEVPPPRHESQTGGQQNMGRQLLAAELTVNKQSFLEGELIVIKGFVRNISARPLMLQTREPFLEGRLTASPGNDRFPKQPPNKRLRLSDFSQLNPGQKLEFFEETFVAGAVDPDWVMGERREFFAPPFADLGQRQVKFEMSSKGIFPNDRQPKVGIWTGRVESKSVTISQIAASKPADHRKP